NHLHRRGVRGVAQDGLVAHGGPLLRGHVRGRALGIDLAVAVDVRPAVACAPAQLVELFDRSVVAEPVDAVIHAVQAARDRVPAEADGVAQSGREDLAPARAGIDAQQGRALRVRLLAGVARRADGHVQEVVRTEGERAVGMRAAIRQSFRQPLEIRDAAVFAQVPRVHGLHVGQIDPLAADRDAVPPVDLQYYFLHVRDAVAVRVSQHHHVSRLALRDVDRAVRGDRHHAWVVQALRIALYEKV